MTLANDIFFGAIQDLVKTDLLVGAHGPVKISIERISRNALRDHWHIDAASSGLIVDYRGHKEDLAAAGVLPADRPYDRFCDDGHGGVWWLTSKAGKGHRGIVAIAYYSCNRSFLRLLPGVLDLCPDALLQIASKPRLQLVVDNTREAPKAVVHG
jgi:hypothetical protein